MSVRTAPAPTALPHTGEAPYGSCLLQAAANVLELRGLTDAPAHLGITCGATWTQGDRKLGASRRWDSAVSALGEVTVERRRFDTAEQAREAEAAALAQGHGLIVAVDSFDIPSPYTGATHLMHALIVDAALPDGSVLVRDAMNRPEQSVLSADDFRLSRQRAVVDGHELVVVRGHAAGPASPTMLLRSLHDDIARHAEIDGEALAAYVEASRAPDAFVDVADVAAERLYTQRLLTGVAEHLPELGGAASAFGSLSRRWYLLHTLSLEAQAGRPLKPGRLESVLEDLRQRERTARAALLDAATPHLAATGPLPETNRTSTP